MKEFVMSSLMDQQLKQDDDVTDQNVNQTRTTENDPEPDVYQVRIQEKVETIWLFDTGNDADAMPEPVWEQLGELFTANNKSNAERSKWTRSWSHG